MPSIKGNINNIVRGLVEKIGFLLNPIVLNVKGEDNQLLIFYFHGLYRSLKQKDLNHIDPQKNMTVNQFDDFIDYFLNHNYSFVKPEDLLGELNVNQHYAMITFDDGYFNNVLAVEKLRRYKIPAIFFITPKNILENKSFWWDIIYKNRYKQGTSIEKITKEQEYLKKFKHNYIEEYIKQNFGLQSYKPWSDIDRPLTEIEVKILSQDPFISFGNHTFNHAILINYNREEVEEEFINSNKFLDDLTGTTPISVAFPNGSYNKLTLDVAEKVGFIFAFNAEPKKNYLPSKKGSLVCLNRFIATTNKIEKYGSFYRLGYTPGSIYSNIRGSLDHLLNKIIL